MSEAGIAYVGLGANLGAREQALAGAVQALADTPGLRLSGLSSCWSSAPVDAEGPDFVNAVARLDCALAPLALLDRLQALEAAAGRRRPYRHAPRTLDLDLIDMPGHPLQHPRLQLPHPRAAARLFVLLPLLELWPDAAWPAWGRAEACARRLAAAQRLQRLPADARWQALQARCEKPHDQPSFQRPLSCKPPSSDEEPR
ncbi:MAG: 2-amino-4-hydroxy-6-hydroxymethyldihydropteridine diphosphokinase [Rubrivivax sp.]